MPTKQKSTLLPPPFYPFLFAIFPILSLLGHNIQELPLGAANRAFAVAIGSTFLIFAIHQFLTRNIHKAGLLTTWSVFILMNYGRLHEAVLGMSIFGFVWGRHLFLVPIMFVLYAVVAILINKKMKTSPSFTQVLNIFAVFLLVIPTYQVLNHSFQTLQASQDVRKQPETALSNASTRPDVYIIILDSHLRADVLQESFGYDNQPFIDELTAMGFYVAPCSMSNYAYTPLSISSLLNMNYIEQLGEYSPTSQDRTPLFELVEQNAVRKNLESLGYQSIDIVSYQPLAWEGAAGHIATDPASISAKTSNGNLTQFERMAAKATILKILLDRKVLWSASDAIPPNYPYADHVQQQYYIFDQLQQTSTIRGPKLVFVHINIPHPPYVFNPDGSLIQDPPELPWIQPLPHDQYQALYPGQISYIDQEIIPLLKQLIRQSQPAPIIVLQGDHGADSSNRLAILNAYYVPEKTRRELYSSISPVNSFRIIFNTVFGANYELLEDRSYLSSQQALYLFEPYPETMPNCKK